MLYILTSFFNATAATAIYSLSLHDALPISRSCSCSRNWSPARHRRRRADGASALRCAPSRPLRSEEHTSELQSRFDLVCRLLLEKKNKDGHNFHQLVLPVAECLNHLVILHS